MSPNSETAVSSRILRMDGNQMKLALASLLCIVALVFPFVLANAGIYFFGVYYEDGELMMTGLSVLAYPILLLGAGILVSLPCVCGIYTLAARISRGEMPPVSVILEPFVSSKAYSSAISSGFVAILRIAIVASPAVGGIALLGGALDMVNVFSLMIKAAVVVFMILAIAAASCMAVLLQSYLFFYEALRQRGMTFWGAICASVRMSRGRKLDIFRYLCSHAELVILSVITLGMIVPFYTVPKMSVSYFVYTDKYFDDNKFDIK